MSHAFRELLRKIGSGPHTGKDLTREEAMAATRMMLLQEATPAQIGAFMVAHRIRRPTPAEMAGMLDAYDQLGPKVSIIQSPYPLTVLSSPYDGRDRTTPVTTLVALLLATVGHAVLLHGGDRMPTKEGVPLVELWQGLGVDWTGLSLDQVHEVLQAVGLGLVYLPKHFPLAQALVPYREQIGKRPPFATLELMWSPYLGDAHLMVGFVHPPTENLARETFELRGTTSFTTVKGLEGSCDLPRERTAIIGLERDRLHLSPYDYGFGGKNVPFQATAQAVEDMVAVLQGQSTELMQSVIWSGGFYLWRCGVCTDLPTGFARARSLLLEGEAMQTLLGVKKAIAQVQFTHQR